MDNCVHDIGAFAALAFENPREYIDQGLEIAGDELTELHAVAIMSHVIGSRVSAVPARSGDLVETISGLSARQPGDTP